MILGSVGGAGCVTVGLARYLAVTQRTALRKTICARPFCVAPVTESRVPFFTSATVRASEPELVRMSKSAVATRVPITAGSPVRDLARYWIAAQPRYRPLTTSANPRAVLPVVVTRVPSANTRMTAYVSPGPLRRFRAVVVTFTTPASTRLGGGRSAPRLRYRLATQADEPENLILDQPRILPISVTVCPRYSPPTTRAVV